jgi:hypothetical protein
MCVIGHNNTGSHFPCGLCGEMWDFDVGYQVEDDHSHAMLCPGCAQRHAPHLVVASSLLNLCHEPHPDDERAVQNQDKLLSHVQDLLRIGIKNCFRLRYALAEQIHSQIGCFLSHDSGEVVRCVQHILDLPPGEQEAAIAKRREDNKRFMAEVGHQ